MTVAKTILEQLGGNKFIAMTGAREIVDCENGLKMRLSKNKSKANYLQITLNDLDLYDMEFTQYVAPKFNLKTGIMRDEKISQVAEFNGVYFDNLQNIYTSVTGQDTSL